MSRDRIIFEKSVRCTNTFLGQEFERLKTLTEQMSEAMGEDMVELPKLETEKDEEDEQVLDDRGLIPSLKCICFTGACQ